MSTWVYIEGDLYLDQKVESMVSYTSWTVENNGGGVCTCRRSDATLKSVQGTKRKVKLENIISDSSVMRSIYRAPSERLPY
jgi:hypothetical protein